MFDELDKAQRSLRRRSKWCEWLLALFALINAGLFGLLLAVVVKLLAVAADGPAFYTFLALFLAWLGLIIAMGVAWPLWIYRAFRLETGAPTFQAIGWALAPLVPGAGLVLSHQAMRRLLRDSLERNPHEGDPQSRELGGWTGSRVLGQVAFAILFIEAVVLTPQGNSILTNAYERQTMALVMFASMSIAAFFLRRLIRSITSRELALPLVGEVFD